MPPTADPIKFEAESLPVKLLDRALLMGHEDLARALIELIQIGKTPSSGIPIPSRTVYDQNRPCQGVATSAPLTMRERVESMGGTLRIGMAQHHGTTVRITVPMKRSVPGSQAS